MLDDDLLRRIGNRRWVSMSLERALGIPPETPINSIQLDKAVVFNLHGGLKTSPEESKSAAEYISGPELDANEKSKQCSTVFQANMPGAMSLAEVENQIDLGRWKLMIGQRLVNLEV